MPADAVTHVEESVLPTGSLTVVAYDGATGGPPQTHFCATVRIEGLVVGSRCTWADGQDSVDFCTLGPGIYEVSVETVGKPATTTADVQSGQSTTVRVPIG